MRSHHSEQTFGSLETLYWLLVVLLYVEEAAITNKCSINTTEIQEKLKNCIILTELCFHCFTAALLKEQRIPVKQKSCLGDTSSTPNLKKHLLAKYSSSTPLEVQ